MARFFFCCRREDRFLQFAGRCQSRLERNAADCAGLLVLLESRTGEVTARDALDRNDAAFLHDDAAAAQLIVSAHFRRKACELHFDDMVLDIVEVREPEVRDLRQHASLVRNARREDDVECGDAIRSDEQEVLVEVIDVTNFSPTSERKRQTCLDDRAHARAL